jgi:hypothetical protein
VIHSAWPRARHRRTKTACEDATIEKRSMAALAE